MDHSIYEARLQKIREETRSAGLDGLFVYGWKRGQIKYISGYYPNYIANTAAIFIPTEGNVCMWVRFPFDLERAKNHSWITDIRTSGGIYEIGMDFVQEMRARELEHSRLGYVTGDFVMDEIPFSLFSQIRQELPQIEWKNMIPVFDRLRVIKEPGEYDMIRECAQLADLGAARATNLIQTDNSECMIVAEIEYTLRKNGADDMLVVISSDGANQLIGPPDPERKLKTGRNVVVEIAVKYKGYWTQVARTFSVKPSTDQQERIYTTVHDAYKMVAKSLTSGSIANETAYILSKILSEKGYGDSIEQDFGHGIGFDLPEMPRLAPHDNTLLETGMVIVVHPAIRKKGTGGAFIGGTVLMTEKGPELLHSIPKELP